MVFRRGKSVYGLQRKGKTGLINQTPTFGITLSCNIRKKDREKNGNERI